MLENKTRGGIQKKISIHPTKPDKGALKRSKHYIFLLLTYGNGNFDLLCPCQGEIARELKKKGAAYRLANCCVGAFAAFPAILAFAASSRAGS